MLLSLFLHTFSKDLDRNGGMADTSAFQRYRALQRALKVWSDSWRRRNVNGFAQVVQGNQFVTLPYDFHSTSYLMLQQASTPGQQFGVSGIIAPTLSDYLISFGYGISFINPFNSALGSSNFAPGYDSSIAQNDILTTNSDRGRKAIDLITPAPSSTPISIRYNAIHQVEDEGKLLTVNLLPIDGDTMRVGSQTNNQLFTFRDNPSATFDIQIESDIFIQSQRITDALNLIQMMAEKSNGNASPFIDIQAMENANTVLLRPLIDGPNLNLMLTVDGTRLSSNRLNALKTFDDTDAEYIFHGWLHNIFEQKNSLALTKGQNALAAEYAKSGERHRKLFYAAMCEGR